MEPNDISGAVVDAAVRVHSEIGPGLLESAYESCLAFELRDRGLEVETQKVLPVVYRGVELDAGYRIDLLVNGVVIVELKSVKEVADIHKAQLLTYLKLSKVPIGLLLNFNVPLMKKGIHRFVV
jgi:GxxExxY protein